jgi:predicted 2-oxoglutarate/Fe(II)-dependent dioxygenase YbiX
MNQINNKIYQKEIFPITYFQDHIENNNEIKKILIKKIQEDCNNLQIPEGWITNKIHTSFSSKDSKKQIFFDKDSIYEKLLSSAYEKCFDHFFDAPYQISIEDIWYNHYIDNEYQEFHNHIGDFYNVTHFACVHFLSFDSDTHESTVFKDPNIDIRYHSVDFANSGYTGHHTPKIKEGDFIMFPSYLNHCVYPVKSATNYPRITIALNIKLLEYGTDE